ncbi:MAG: Vms1/Ankzf1 family peptidyl-tRNA hydrolase [Peptococcaceae bacterium]|nr:Vms1/Ankzf1 family peptidyl-tRNA hydrolase [Peptococcaceae bacterium]
MSNFDLKRLAELTAPEQTFLSIFLSGPHSAVELEKKFDKLRHVLKSTEANKGELEHFDANVKTVAEYLKKNPLQTGSLCILACQAINFFQAIALPEPINDVIRIDSSPYIRPLAELYDDYENVAVVVADNEKVRIFLVSANVTGTAEVIKGNIKNHVKVGGWSQKRYERRRDKQLLHYAREITDALLKLDRDDKYRHILLVGSKEILNIVHQNMPKDLQNKLIEKNLDLSKGEGSVNHDIMTLLSDEELHFQQDYWEHIRAEYLRGGLAVVGLDDVLQAAQEERVEKMVVSRAFHPQIKRCQSCHTLNKGEVGACTACGSTLLFKVSVINEILDMLLKSGAEFHFADSIPELEEVGGIAALVRYAGFAAP